MAFRDDRDAQLARAEALERENARLKEELERHVAEAATAVAEAEARGRAKGKDAASADAAPLAKANARLREELARARGPGLARRIATKLSSLRLAAPSGDGGYWRAALEVWRIHAPIAVALLVTSPIVGGRAAWVALGFAFAAPAFAALVLLVPWLLRRRRRAIAGMLAAGALGPPLTVALVAPVLTDGLTMACAYRAGAIAGIALLGMVILRGIRFHPVMPFVLVFFPLLALPHPGQVLIWIGLAGAGWELIEPSKD